MTRKTTLLLLLVAFAAFSSVPALAGCGNNTSRSSNTTPAGTPVPATGTTAGGGVNR
jgi:hypothetical protein